MKFLILLGVLLCFLSIYEATDLRVDERFGGLEIELGGNHVVGEKKSKKCELIKKAGYEANVTLDNAKLVELSLANYQAAVEKAQTKTDAAAAAEAKEAAAVSYAKLLADLAKKAKNEAKKAQDKANNHSIIASTAQTEANTAVRNALSAEQDKKNAEIEFINAKADFEAANISLICANNLVACIQARVDAAQADLDIATLYDLYNLTAREEAAGKVEYLAILQAEKERLALEAQRDVWSAQLNANLALLAKVTAEELLAAVQTQVYNANKTAIDIAQATSEAVDSLPHSGTNNCRRDVRNNMYVDYAIGNATIAIQAQLDLDQAKNNLDAAKDQLNKFQQQQIDQTLEADFKASVFVNATIKRDEAINNVSTATSQQDTIQMYLNELLSDCQQNITAYQLANQNSVNLTALRDAITSRRNALNVTTDSIEIANLNALLATLDDEIVAAIEALMQARAALDACISLAAQTKQNLVLQTNLVSVVSLINISISAQWQAAYTASLSINATLYETINSTIPNQINVVNDTQGAYDTALTNFNIWNNTLDTALNGFPSCASGVVSLLRKGIEANLTLARLKVLLESRKISVQISINASLNVELSVNAAMLAYQYALGNLTDINAAYIQAQKDLAAQEAITSMTAYIVSLEQAELDRANSELSTAQNQQTDAQNNYNTALDKKNNKKSKLDNKIQAADNAEKKKKDALYKAAYKAAKAKAFQAFAAEEALDAIETAEKAILAGDAAHMACAKTKAAQAEARAAQEAAAQAALAVLQASQATTNEASEVLKTLQCLIPRVCHHRHHHHHHGLFEHNEVHVHNGGHGHFEHNEHHGHFEHNQGHGHFEHNEHHGHFEHNQGHGNGFEQNRGLELFVKRGSHKSKSFELNQHHGGGGVGNGWENRGGEKWENRGGEKNKFEHMNWEAQAGQKAKSSSSSSSK